MSGRSSTRRNQEQDAAASPAGRGLSRLGFLRVAALAGSGLLFGPPAVAEGADTRAAAAAPRVQRFVSRPDLVPPVVTVLHPAQETAPGLVFIAPSSGPGQRGVAILDNHGEIVWFHPTTPNTAMNFRAGSYRGKPVLTWWEGKTQHGLGVGEHVVFDASYGEIARFPAGGHRASDLHELVLTSRGTAYVTSYETVPMDLSAVGGPANGRVIGGIVQEVAIPSGRLLWEWRSLEHVPLDEGYTKKPGNPYDYFHVNSIDVTPNGDLVVSARNTWAVYLISRTSGEILWRLGGKKSDFRMGRGTIFAWQHDARLHGDGTLLSVFDDGAAPQVQPQSKGMLIRLDHARRRATLVRSYVHRPNRLVARFMGNAQLLDDGHLFVGWGSEPYFTEFAADGSIRYDARLPHGGENYRAFRLPWTATPAEPPALAYSAARHALYASWNGATEVAAWRLSTGSAADALQPAGTTARQGFETQIPAPAPGTYAAVAALDRGGRSLGESAAVLVA